MSKKCSNQMQLPPPASRHRGVLVVNTPVPHYDFGSRIGGAATLSSLIDETRNDGHPTVALCIREKQMVEMTVRCYDSSLDVIADHDMKDDEDSGNVALFKEIQIVMPKTWTPRMYFGAACFIHWPKLICFNRIYWFRRSKINLSQQYSLAFYGWKPNWLVISCKQTDIKCSIL